MKESEALFTQQTANYFNKRVKQFKDAIYLSSTWDIETPKSCEWPNPGSEPLPDYSEGFYTVATFARVGTKFNEL